MNITVIRPLGRDQWGDPIAGDPTEMTVPVLAVAPTALGSRKGSSDIEDRNREGLVESCTVYLRDTDVDIVHTDKVLLPGDTREWDVDGGVQRWNYEPSTLGGAVVVLKRRVG